MFFTYYVKLLVSREFGKKCSKLEFDYDNTNEELCKVGYRGIYTVQNYRILHS